MIKEKIEFEFNGYKAIANCYFIENSVEIDINRKRACGIILPGGGYQMTSDREAEPIAYQLLANDMSAIVLRYSCSPAKYPTALCQTALTVKFLRDNADKFNIDSNKIYIFGGSAGGHLAASLGVFWHKEFLCNLLNVTPEIIKPNCLILSYPVISSGKFGHEGSYRMLLADDYNETTSEFQSLDLQVDENTPRTFLWHTADDDTVPVENSLLFAAALSKNKIEFELHIYPKGIHGLALANYITGNYPAVNEPHCQDWLKKAFEFLKLNDKIISD